MSMTIDDIDDLDVFEEGYEQDSDMPSYLEEDTSYQNDNYDQYSEDYYDEEDEEDYRDEEDVLTSYLRSKGINPESVKFENSDGELEEVSFNDLSKDEQLQLLQYNDLDDNYGLTEDEVALINQLRYNNLSVQDYTNYIARNAVNNYAAQVHNSQKQMSVDSIPDDELFLIDLKARIPDVSDEEAWEELSNAKSNESVYSRKVNSIRDEYREKEMLLEQQEQEEAARSHAQMMEQFENVVVNSIQKNSTIDLGDSALELSTDDKNQLASFILDEDATGVRHISKALNDPDTLVRMAWYALKGEETIRQISDYYKKQISEVSKYNYNKGYEDARSGKAANTSKSIVKKQNTTSRGNRKRPLTIDDID